MSVNSNKIRVAVLYGGRSGEHEVSLRSATNVIQNLDKERFEVVPIGIDKQGVWYLGDDSVQRRLEQDGTLHLSQDQVNMLFAPELLGHQVPTKSVTALNKMGRLFDVIFPVIHGPLCEDGTVQGLLELADVPYVGSSVLASAVGMDKDISKRLVKSVGIHVTPYLTFNYGQWQKNAERILNSISEKLDFPVFVKPINTGSSVGVHRVKTAEALSAAIENAFLYENKVIVEQGIEGMELEVALLESRDYGAEPFVSVVGEVRPQNGHEFYSYAAKYMDADGAAIIIPAPIAADIQAKIQKVAQNIFMALDCEGMARVDLFLEKGTNNIFFNEVNTIPGFTNMSMYPMMIEASGISYKDLLSHLIDLAIDRHGRKGRLHREYVPE